MTKQKYKSTTEAYFSKREVVSIYMYTKEGRLTNNLDTLGETQKTHTHLLSGLEVRLQFYTYMHRAMKIR